MSLDEMSIYVLDDPPRPAHSSVTGVYTLAAVAERAQSDNKECVFGSKTFTRALWLVVNLDDDDVREVVIGQEKNISPRMLTIYLFKARKKERFFTIDARIR